MGISARTEDVLQNEVNNWEAIWRRHPDAGAPWRQPWESWGVPKRDLPRITPEMLRLAALCFKSNKSFLGPCARWFARLGDGALEEVAKLLMSREEVGCWHGSVRHALLHLISKKGGGKRPIGIVNGLVILWERTKRPLVRGWRQDNAREYDYGGRGRLSSSAVWLQALYDEVADAVGDAAITVLLDLMKAFESVPLERIWEEGLRRGFPPLVLRLSLEVCAFVRHPTLEGWSPKGSFPFRPLWRVRHLPRTCSTRS